MPLEAAPQGRFGMRPAILGGPGRLRLGGQVLLPHCRLESNALGYALRWARNLDAKGQLPGEESDPFDPKFRKNI